MLSDEVASTGLKIWGFILHENWPLDVESFAESIGLREELPNLFVGKLQRCAPSDLSDGNKWISSNYLSFGSSEVQAGSNGKNTC